VRLRGVASFQTFTEAADEATVAGSTMATTPASISPRVSDDVAGFVLQNFLAPERGAQH